MAAFIYLLITFVVTLLFKFAEKKTITIKEETAMSVIEVQNLRKNFGSLEVLRDVSFSVEKGRRGRHHRFLRFEARARCCGA